jgi:hypothetical protein
MDPVAESSIGISIGQRGRAVHEPLGDDLRRCIVRVGLALPRGACMLAVGGMDWVRTRSGEFCGGIHTLLCGEMHALVWDKTHALMQPQAIA